MLEPNRSAVFSARKGLAVVLALALAMACEEGSDAGPDPEPSGADLEIRLLAPERVPADSLASIAITVVNRGPDDAAAISVVDSLSGGSVAQATPTGTIAPGGAVVSWSAIPFLRSGDSLNLGLLVSPGPGDTIRSTARVTASTGDPVSANDRAVTSVRVEARASLRLEKTGPDAAMPGDTLTYRLMVRNAGPSPARDLSLRDSLPPNVRFLTADADGDTTASGVIEWPLVSTLEAEDSLVRTVMVTVSESADGTVLNRAYVSSRTVDPDPADDSARAITNVEAPAADLSVAHSGPDTVQVGDTVSLSVQVVNRGPSVADAVTVTDTLSSGLAFLDASHGGTASGGVVTWPTLASMAVADTMVLSLRAVATSSGTSSSRVAARSATPDPVPSNDGASLSILVRPLPPPSGFRTGQPAQARALVGGVEVTPLLTVGDTLPGSGLPWAPIPDGLGAYRSGGKLILHANHEIQPLALPGSPYLFARVSRLELDLATLRITDGRYVVDGSEGYLALCSATWGDATNGFPIPGLGVFFTGEETPAGRQLAIRSDGTVIPMPWIGLWAHENLVPVPGFPGRVVLIGLDDWNDVSELYMYEAATAEDVLAGNGTLRVFRTEDVATSSDMTVGQTVTGSWVDVGDAAALTFDQLQAHVESLGAFPFRRLEDGDYDRRSGLSAPGFYFADTGSSPGTDPFGSLYRMEFDPANPAVDSRLRLLARSQGPAATGWARPDNLATSASSLMVQEDPGVGPEPRAGRIIRFPILPDGSLGDPQPLVELLDHPCETNEICWESSGIMNAARWLGPGTWLFTVQAHSLPVPRLGLASENGQLLLLRAPGT